MPVEIIRLIEDPRLLLGIAEVEGGTVRESSPALRSVADALAAQMGRADYEIPEDKRRAVRQLLKLGGFSATGRNRPSHELLLNDLKERGEFHYINNVVDTNNVVSLEALLPISIFDADKLGGQCVVRVGREGEGYVFNASGQWLDVKRCIVCCRMAGGAGILPVDNDFLPGLPADAGGDARATEMSTGTEAGPTGEPIGTPVKDSMATKIFEGASRYLGVIYASREGWTETEMQSHTQRFADLLAAETGGNIVRVELM